MRLEIWANKLHIMQKRVRYCVQQFFKELNEARIDRKGYQPLNFSGNNVSNASDMSFSITVTLIPDLNIIFRSELFCFINIKFVNSIIGVSGSKDSSTPLT